MHDALMRWTAFSLITAAAFLLLTACARSERLPIPTSDPNSIPVSAGTTPPAPTPSPEPVAIDPGPVPTPGFCLPADELQNVGGTPASPYFVVHPETGDATTQTIMFVPGGRGSRRGAERVWSNYMAEGVGLENFRLVIPYAEDFDLLDDTRRVLTIVPEVLACYGGEPGGVHLAGVSNGGLIAFSLMVNSPELFTSLLGAPGAFPTTDPSAWRDVPPEWAEKLIGKRVFNGVGELDEDWQPEVRATHESLSAQGVDSVYVEFSGQNHGLDEAFDESTIVEFWTNP